MADAKRGFASMDDEKQREIAKKGGQAAHDKGAAHEFSSEEAREAGSKVGRPLTTRAQGTSSRKGGSRSRP
jgi:general stress protein YciG